MDFWDYNDMCKVKICTIFSLEIKAFVLLIGDLFFFENTVDPDQLASDEAT